MREYKYFVHDDDGKILDKEFDNFADAFDYAQTGLITFIYEIPYIDGVEQEDEEEIVWSWDETWSREEAVDRIAARHSDKENCENCEEDFEVELHATAKPEDVASLAKLIFGDDFDSEFEDPVDVVEVPDVEAPEFDAAEEKEEVKYDEDKIFDDDFDEKEESLTEETHDKYAKPEGDRVASYNSALKYAKQENKPFIYGYTAKQEDGIKFFALPQPIKCSDEPQEAEKKFRNQYKNCITVYFAYPDKDFVEALEEDITDEEFVEAFGKELIKKHECENCEETLEEGIFDPKLKNYIDTCTAYGLDKETNKEVEAKDFTKIEDAEKYAEALSKRQDILLAYVKVKSLKSDIGKIKVDDQISVFSDGKIYSDNKQKMVDSIKADKKVQKFAGKEAAPETKDTEVKPAEEVKSEETKPEVKETPAPTSIQKKHTEMNNKIVDALEDAGADKEFLDELNTPTGTEGHKQRVKLNKLRKAIFGEAIDWTRLNKRRLTESWLDKVRTSIETNIGKPVNIACGLEGECIGYDDMCSDLAVDVSKEENGKYCTWEYEENMDGPIDDPDISEEFDSWEDLINYCLERKFIEKSDLE